jgi:hypothetical protein
MAMDIPPQMPSSILGKRQRDHSNNTVSTKPSPQRYCETSKQFDAAADIDIRRPIKRRTELPESHCSPAPTICFNVEVPSPHSFLSRSQSWPSTVSSPSRQPQSTPRARILLKPRAPLHPSRNQQSYRLTIKSSNLETKETAIIDQSACHACGRKPWKKTELALYVDCPLCSKRTCKICIRCCVGNCGKEVCRDCSVEKGEDGDAWCIECLSEEDMDMVIDSR